jgi:2Fe-2S ferredoxin
VPKVTYIAHHGHATTIDVPLGSTVMRGAVDNGVRGIDGDCGGQCACATCHVYVDAAWLERTGGRNANEEAMLDFAAGTEANSRLGCQITLTAELDGLVVRLPEGQH